MGVWGQNRPKGGVISQHDFYNFVPFLWEFSKVLVGLISHCVLLTHVGIPSHVCRSPWDFPLYAIDLGGNSQPSINVGPSGICHYVLLTCVGIPSHVCI
ncbi:hypothetical protein PAXRUDRAFT_160821, partial [Paxillus rubicundulus Ve08.2h10]